MLGLGLGLGGWNPVPAGRSAVWILYTVMESPEGAAKERWGAAACDVTWKAAVLFLCTLIDVTLGNTRGSGMILEGGQTAATPSTRLQPGRRDGSKQTAAARIWMGNECQVVRDRKSEQGEETSETCRKQDRNASHSRSDLCVCNPPVDGALRRVFFTLGNSALTPYLPRLPTGYPVIHYSRDSRRDKSAFGCLHAPNPYFFCLCDFFFAWSKDM